MRVHTKARGTQDTANQRDTKACVTQCSKAAGHEGTRSAGQCRKSAGLESIC
jgi:hypothetical protein